MRSLVLRLATAGLLLGLSTGARAKKIDDLLASLVAQTGSVFYLFTVVCAFVGVWFVYMGLRGLHEASKGGQQAIPARAFVVAIFAGGGLTSVSIWAVMAANSLSA